MKNVAFIFGCLIVLIISCHIFNNEEMISSLFSIEEQGCFVYLDDKDFDSLYRNEGLYRENLEEIYQDYCGEND